MKSEKIINTLKENELNQGISLKESLQSVAKNGAKGLISKSFIADFLEKEYDNVEVNRRELSTTPCKGRNDGLPLADTHFILKNEKRKCFIYVYESDGFVLFLVKVPKSYGEELKENHKLVSFSSFPRVGKDTWYSIPVDDSWTVSDVLKMLDSVKKLNEESLDQ